MGITAVGGLAEQQREKAQRWFSGPGLGTCGPSKGSVSPKLLFPFTLSRHLPFHTPSKYTVEFSRGYITCDITAD